MTTSVTSPQPVPALPPGYTCRGDLFADLAQSYPSERHLLIAANFLALVPLGVAVVILWLPYQFYAALGAPLALFDAPDWPQWGYWLAGLALVGASLFVHEGLHGLALVLQGHRPRFGYESGYPYAAVQHGEYLTRRQYLIMALTPLTVMTVAGGLLLPFLPPAFGQMQLIVLLLNTAACLGDLAVADRVRRWPADTLFAADDEGIKVFTSG